jgi:UDP-glucose 4-epimerase
MSKKRILVIGGAGFIGSHLVDALIEEENRVIVIDNLFLGQRQNVNRSAVFIELDPIYEKERLRFILTHDKIDLVYNLAVLPLPHSLEYPFKNISDNILLVQILCEELRCGFYKRLIHFSSSEVYGSAQYSPMCESHPIEPSTPYAASKAAGDMICLSYWKTFGCNISIVRPFNNYGPRQNAAGYAGVIPLTINRILDGLPPIIYGDGKQTRDYIHVCDTARAAVLLGEQDLPGEVINVASGHDISIAWLVEKIVVLMKGSHSIIFAPERPGDVRRHIANTLKAKDLLDFEHVIGMEAGLRETIDWFKMKRG